MNPGEKYYRVILMKRSFAGIVAAILAAILFLDVDVFAYSAEHAIVVDADTGRVLYEKDAEHRALIASTTKIMTALVTCEQCNVLDRVRIPEEAVGIEGSSMYLQAGEILTIQELLYGMMLHSGNDAATALAIYCGGTVDGFVKMMNEKADKLGLENTHFQNPHGLDALDHYSTAADLAVLAAYAMRNPIFRSTVSTKQIKVGNRVLRNHNKMLWKFEGADGVKTGFTRAAGRILVSSASREGRRLVAVTINAPDDWEDHRSMLEKGFSNYSMVQLVEQGDFLGFIEVAGGTDGKVPLYAASDFSYLLSNGDNVRILIKDSGFVYAPVVAGQNAGNAYVLIDDCPVGKIPMVFGESVEQIASPKTTIWQIIFRRKAA